MARAGDAEALHGSEHGLLDCAVEAVIPIQGLRYSILHSVGDRGEDEVLVLLDCAGEDLEDPLGDDLAGCIVHVRVVEEAVDATLDVGREVPAYLWGREGTVEVFHDHGDEFLLHDFSYRVFVVEDLAEAVVVEEFSDVGFCCLVDDGWGQGLDDGVVHGLLEVEPIERLLVKPYLYWDC